MIDAHTHILPCMDDGSPDVNTSLEMLNRLSMQNVDTVFATPHFYAKDESPERFLYRRSQAFASLNARRAKKNAKPEILLGAEVQCFPGMGDAKAMDALCVQGTRMILVEMPFSKWTPWVYMELRGLRERGMRPILAHINRYPAYRKTELLKELRDAGICLQINAEAFEGFFSAKRAARLVMEKCVQLIGSDCHDLTDRPPNITRAAETLKRLNGSEALENFVRQGDYLLQSETGI